MSLLRSGFRGFQASTSIQAISLLKPTTSIQRLHILAQTPFLSSNTSQSSTNTLQRTFFTTTLPWIPSRHASTTSTATSTTSSSAGLSSNNESFLNWNEFLRLRRIRRFYNLGGSILMATTGLFSGAAFMAGQDITSWGQTVGLDPFVVMGLCTLSSAGLGWLLGPVIGSGVFGLLYRRFSSSMRLKERDFFDRIKKYRVDPTSSSMQNPVPDYYGEKITSVAGYRRWLKDQRAFNRKRQSFI